MRLRNMILGDMKFQYKYGFYGIYIILVVFYACIFFALPDSMRQKAALIMILTDPAAMGLFFMGAILMLEKSQRVLDTIAITPVRVWEYIISKAVSISVISILVGIILAVLSGNSNLFGIIVGTLFGSIIFTMIGLLIAVHTNSLNSFMIGTVPIELIFFFPAVLYLFGYQSRWLLLHPACAIMHLYTGVTGDILLSIIVCIVWAILILSVTCKAVRRMMKQLGGIKL